MAIVKSDRQGTGYFGSYILQRIRNNQNFIAAITGQTGSGKSWSALRLAQNIDSDFTAENICFTARQFMDLVNGKVKHLRKGSVILFDEFQVSMSHLEYQSLIAKLLNYVLQTFRHRNFVLLITTPHFSFINASARKLFHSRLETVSIDRNKKMVKLKPFLIQVNQRSGVAYFKYLRVWHKEYGLVPLKVLKLMMPSDELIRSYEEKKTQFTNELNESIAEDLKKLDGEDDRKPLTEMQEEILEDLQSGLLLPQIAEKRGVVLQAIYDHLKWIRKKGVVIRPVKDGSRVLSYKVIDNAGV